jgi:hexosaminidase
MKKKLLLFSLVVVMNAVALNGQSFNILPYPNKLEVGKGFFNLNTNIQIVNAIKDPMVTPTINLLNDHLKNYTNTKVAQAKATFYINLDSTITNSEGYTLHIAPNKIVLKGNSPIGIFYGVQTFLQIEQQFNNTKSIPTVYIQDAPALSYRGLMLDVSRHFFPIDFVKKLVDIMSVQKMNNLHLHLTDDQGWRIEIKKYPKLVEVGAYRNGTIIGKFPGDGNTNLRYGGFYTQAELKELVRYAQSKFINIVPEIEMPGHASAAIAAYPALSTFESEKMVQQTWGVFEDVFSPSEYTFNFLQDVLDEVMAIFPSPVIHIGGDECPKEAWKRSAFCQQLMKEKGIKDEHALQSYFIQRIEKYINSKGRQIIGWDEILEGGLAPNAKVMSWRGEAGGIEAAKQHHEVIMTPIDYCYFNFYQSTNPKDSIAWGGFLPLSKVYNYIPMPKDLNEQDASYIKGIQANLWTEYISNVKLAEYMLFPRSIAFAEVAWSKQKPGFDHFIKRLVPYLSQLKAKNIHYSTQLFDIKIKSKLNEQKNSFQLTASGVVSPAELIYEMSGRPLSVQSPKLVAPLTVSQTATISIGALFENTVVNEVHAEFTINKATTATIIHTTTPDPAYNQSGALGWCNGIIGSSNRFNDGEWLGYNGKPFETVMQFNKIESLKNVQLHFFQSKGSWVYLPKSVEILSSMDGVNFNLVARQDKFEKRDDGKFTLNIATPLSQAKYLKIIAQPLDKIPVGNTGAGSPAWLFIDEIMVN